jgi:cytochrome c oxidase cbb3-type subunit 2
MTFRTFFIGLLASFGLAWLLVVIVPFFKMRDLKPIEFKDGVDEKTGLYFPKREGRVANGAKVYAENGCYLCHTQVVRPTYAGNDLYREDWGGLKDNGDGIDTRRETNAFDFAYETFAQIGVSRLGPDLSNLGRRVESIYTTPQDAEGWLYRHLYMPRYEVSRRNSTCPPMRYMFETRKIQGARSELALPFEAEEGEEIVPGPEAQALVSYLLSLKKDDVVPASLNFSPPKAKAEPAAKK